MATGRDTDEHVTVLCPQRKEVATNMSMMHLAGQSLLLEDGLRSPDLGGRVPSICVGYNEQWWRRLQGDGGIGGVGYSEQRWC